MASLRDRVVEIAYRLKDQFSNQISRVTGSIKRVDKETKRAADSIERSNARAGGSFVSLGKAAKGALAAITVRGLINVANQAITTADNIQKLSIRLGASTEALSELRFGAELAGVRFETLTMGLQRMTRRVAEAAKGTGEAQGALRELGLDAERLAQQKPEEQLESIAEAISGVGNASDRVRLAMKLFDSEGVALLQMMQRGAEGIREYRREAERAGVTITQEMADNAADAKDAMAELNASIDALTTTMALKLGPPTAKVVRQLNSELQDLATLSEAAQQWWSGDTDLSFLELATFSAADLREKMDASAAATDRLEEATRGAGASMERLARNSGDAANQARGIEEAIVDVQRETGTAEESLGYYIDKLGDAVRGADELRENSRSFVSEIDALLNPREASLTNVYTDLRAATGAIETGDLETANSLFERMQSTLRTVASEGNESRAETAAWAKRVADLGRQLADLKVDREKVNFLEAEADVDRLTQKLESLRDVQVNVQVNVDDTNLKRVAQEIQTLNGGASGTWSPGATGTWDDLIDEASKRGT